MRIVLTGGTGFVGTHLVRHLQQAGHELLLISRSPQPDSDPMRWILGDFGRPEDFIAAVEEFSPDAVFHLAWEGIPDLSEANSVRNVIGSLQLLSAVGRLSSVRKIVATGSCWEYGPMSGPVNEEAAATPATWFTWAKATVLEYLGRLGEAHGIDWYWPRIFFVYGQGQRAQSLIPSVASALRSGNVPDVRSPFATNDFVHVSDVAEGLARCLADGVPSGIYNLGSGHETEVLSVVREIEEILGQGSTATSAIAKSASQERKPGVVADVTRSREILAWQARVGLRQGLTQFLDDR